MNRAEQIQAAKNLDCILRDLNNGKITKYNARTLLFKNSTGIIKAGKHSKYNGTILATRKKRCLDIYWCLGKLKY